MRKLTTVVVAILVALAVIACGVGGYLWYSTKQQVDQLIAMAKPFAEISYGGIEISPAGSVGVGQVRIMPHFVNDVIAIGSIRLNAPNILALLNIRRQLSQGQLPEAMSISFRQLELPLSGGILGAKPSAHQERTPFDDLETLGCGPVTSFSGTEWGEMGYDRFVGNIETGYRIDVARSQLNLRIDSNTRDWATLGLDIGLALTKPSTSLMELATSLTPKLASLELLFRDDGFNTRRNNYCAAKAGKPIDAFIADHIRLVVERLRANGIDPGPGLIDAYRRFLTEGGQVVITATPPAPINPTELQFYKPEDAIKLLGLKLKVNDASIADLTVNWDAAKVARALGTVPEPVEETTAPAVTQATAAPQKSYHPTPVGELGQHVGKIAKLETRTGAQYRGQLDAVVEGIIRITIRKPSGTATLSLRSNEITSAQVLY
ncbi:MAG: hypothetical protein RKR03_17050 [Candidatus Competibacter sp.]|nr:hypothetical protein [Candidatus Competibacter sp.]